MSGPVREAFEAWSEMFCLALDRRPTGTYESMRTHDTWCAYVAGRDAADAAKVAVPREPTGAMIRAAESYIALAHAEHGIWTHANHWRAMHDAATRESNK